jgi:hypothetical protein
MIIPLLNAYLIENQIMLLSVYLVVRVGHTFVPTTLSNSNLDINNVSFLGIAICTRGTNVSKCPPAGYISLLMLYSESASRPPSGFWMRDDKQLEV